MKTLRLAAALLALPLLFAAPALAEDPVPSAKDYPAPPAGWQVARTAWGDPDLRGMWPVDYLAATPRERPRRARHPHRMDRGGIPGAPRPGRGAHRP